MALICLGGVIVGVGMLLIAIGQSKGGRQQGFVSPSRPVDGFRLRPQSPESEVVMTKAATGKAGQFAQAALGDKITYNHPERGGLTGVILGTVEYVELWQKRKAPDEPWVPTGNVFTAHWLGDTLLYAWKGKLWLLDSYEHLTDTDIQRTFLPPAREFGQSNETAVVTFAYPPGTWTVMDIGKFRVQRAEGQGLRLSAGAVGRFIHCRGGTGLEGRAMVVEDYQEGGGGMDTAWQGWQVTWEDLSNLG